MAAGTRRRSRSSRIALARAGLSRLPWLGVAAVLAALTALTVSPAGLRAATHTANIAGPTECLDRAEAIGASPFNDGEPSVKADPVDPRRLVAVWTRSQQPATSSSVFGRVVLAQRNPGESWRETVIGLGGDGWVDVTPAGTAYVSHLDWFARGVVVHRVVPGQPPGKPVPVRTLKKDWDHPAIAADQRSQIGDVLYVVAGLDRLRLTASSDGGRHWEPAVTFPTPEPGYAPMGAPVIATGGDRIVVAWPEEGSAGYLMRAARYDPIERTFREVATVARFEGWLWWDPFGAASIPSLAVARRGPAAGTAYVTWTQYAHDGEDADVLVSASRDGAAWTAPRRVNDDPAGATQVYPSVSARPDGGALVAWLDSRDGGGGNDAGRMYVAPVSPDGTPGPNVRLTRCPSFPEVPGAYGDYFNFDASQGNLELIFPQIRTPGGYSDVFFLEQVPPGSGARGSAKEAQ